MHSPLKSAVVDFDGAHCIAAGSVIYYCTHAGICHQGLRLWLQACLGSRLAPKAMTILYKDYSDFEPYA